jgi:hypothetical protein
MTIYLFLTYQQSITAISSHTYASDTLEHIQFAEAFHHGQKYIPHPLWHICTIYIGNILHISIHTAALICSTAFLILWYLVVLTFIRSSQKIQNTSIIYLILLIILFIGPLCIPWYNKIIYLGQGSPNIWHNVTLWTVKPFALLTTWFSLEGLEKQNLKKLVLAIIIAIISIFAKPSFIIIFLPALLLYAFAFNEYRNPIFIKFYTILSLLSILVLAYQYTHAFHHKESKIIIDFLGVWSLHSPNIAISILLALAFPMAFILLHSKILQDRYILISWIMIFISIAYYLHSRTIIPMN